MSSTVRNGIAGISQRDLDELREKLAEEQTSSRVASKAQSVLAARLEAARDDVRSYEYAERRIRSLHNERVIHGPPGGNDESKCRLDGDDYPCATLRILNDALYGHGPRR